MCIRDSYIDSYPISCKLLGVLYGVDGDLVDVYKRQPVRYHPKDHVSPVRSIANKKNSAYIPPATCRAYQNLLKPLPTDILKLFFKAFRVRGDVYKRQMAKWVEYVRRRIQLFRVYRLWPSNRNGHCLSLIHIYLKTYSIADAVDPIPHTYGSIRCV